MTVSLTWRDYRDQFRTLDKAELHFDPTDKQDMTRQYKGGFVEGWMRWIQLREGMELLIEKTQNRDRLLLDVPDNIQKLVWYFVLQGKQKSIDFPSCKGTNFSLSEGKFFLHGSGFVDRYFDAFADTGPFLFISIFVRPEVLRSFINDPSGEFPRVLKHLTRPSGSACYKRAGTTSPMMYALLQQILHCSDTGLTKRMYLESKALELLVLLVEEETKIHQGDDPFALLDLSYRDRIHYAQEILLKNITDPPSLMELAQQIGMCDYNLKRGFKEVFGSTVFDYLRDRRMERAQQFLLDGQMKVATVAHAVGYNSPTSFNAAFKQKYGMSPKAYQMAARK